MFSHRRRAQMGLLAACTLLISTLTILYQGSRDVAGAPRATDGVRLVIGDGGDSGLNGSAPPANLAAATTTH
jgi:hypothetical protein